MEMSNNMQNFFVLANQKVIAGATKTEIGA